MLKGARKNPERMVMSCWEKPHSFDEQILIFRLYHANPGVTVLLAGLATLSPQDQFPGFKSDIAVGPIFTMCTIWRGMITWIGQFWLAHVQYDLSAQFQLPRAPPWPKRGICGTPTWP